MKGTFPERLSKFTRSVIIFFGWWAEIDRPIREELDVFGPSDLESWDEIEKKNGNLTRLGRSEYFAEIRMLCYVKPSHTNTHTVGGGPAAKKEIRRFRNRLVRERKVNERRLLRQ